MSETIATHVVPTESNLFVKTVNHKGEINNHPNRPFQFFGKVRLHGDKKFYFEGSNGETTTKRLFAVHHPFDIFDKVAESMGEFGAVAEYRVFENVEGRKTPRLLATYTFPEK